MMTRISDVAKPDPAVMPLNTHTKEDRTPPYAYDSFRFIHSNGEAQDFERVPQRTGFANQ